MLLVPHDVTCKVKGQQSLQLPQISGRTTVASLNAYYRKSAAPVLILNYETLKQLVSSVVTGDNQTHKLTLQATKT